MDTPLEILLKGGRSYTGGRLKHLDILISAGKIQSMGEDIKPTNEKVIDCVGQIILPGLIDAHVHMREPGLTQKEDFSTGSAAAAAGGVTTFLDMPNTRPPTLTAKDLTEKRSLASYKSHVNYGFHFGSSESNIEEIKKAQGVASTKVFMNESTGQMKIDDDQKLGQIFAASRMVMAHAEAEMMSKAATLSKKTGKKLHIAHVSTKEEVAWLEDNKTDNITCEVTPHHLFLQADEGNPLMWVKPTLKTKEDNSALLKAVNSGLIDTLGSDHAPHLISEKLEKTTYGLPGVETLLPLMLDAVNKKKTTLETVVRLCCENPAKIFGIKNKGFIREGYDADVVVVDMECEQTVDEKKLHSKCGWSPYTGWKLAGWPTTTIVGGAIVFADGKVDTSARGREISFIKI